MIVFVGTLLELLIKKNLLLLTWYWLSLCDPRLPQHSTVLKQICCKLVNGADNQSEVAPVAHQFM